MKPLYVVSTIVAFGLVSSAAGAQNLLHLRSRSHAEPSKEQAVFTAEDNGVHEPVAIPDEIKMVLAKDEYVANLLDQKKLTAQKLPAAWFSAAEVHLAGHKEDDLIVMGEGPVRGADGTTFWVFCATPHGYVQALKVSTHTLLVKDLRTKGAKEIEAQTASASEVFSVAYRFDGLQYRSYRELSEPIR